MDTSRPVYRTKEAEFYRRPHNSTVCFVIAILLFFLPFAEFKCGSVPILTNTGIGIATGGSWKVTKSWRQNELMEKLNVNANQEKEMMKDSPNIFAIVVLVAGIFGIAIAFTPLKGKSMAGMCAGLLAVLMMIALMIQMRMEMSSDLAKGKGGKGIDAPGMVDGILRMQFTVWYYFSLVLFIMAAFLNYMRDRIALRDAMAAAVDFDFQRKE